MHSPAPTFSFSLLTHSSASIATLIRLRFLADLEETDDILCPFLPTPAVSVLVLVQH